MDKENKKTSMARVILRKRYIKGDKERLESLALERQNADIAEQIYILRTQAGLSQSQLAELVGTTQSVISRLEDADYTGHSLAMLRKIGLALHQRLEIQFVPETENVA